MKLTNPTDDELNRAFAEKVAGYYVKEEFPGTDFPFTAWQGDRPLSHHRWASAKGPLEHINSFIESANCVLPFLYKRHWEVQQTSSASRPIRVVLDELHGPYGESNTFPRAAVIALLRANGVQVEFTAQ